MESLNETLFAPLSPAEAGRFSGGAIATAPVWTRYIDVMPDGTIAYSYVED
jgi:hypothetical protein